MSKGFRQSQSTLHTWSGLLLGWLLFAGWLILLLHARERRTVPPWWAPLLMAVWANLHASYILGLGIAGLFVLLLFVYPAPLLTAAGAAAQHRK